MTETIIIKIGGALLDDAAEMGALLEGIDVLCNRARVVLVHGGGPQSTALAHRLGHDPLLIHGRRVTSDEDLRIALWTMRGELNARLVASLNARRIRACGISGVDGGTVSATRRPPWTIDGDQVDFGHVGDVVSIGPSILSLLLGDGIVPVVAPLAADADGNILNINADTVATDIAIALAADRLLFVVDSGGIRRDPSDPETLMPALSGAEFEQGVREAWISRGMRVKLENGFRALAGGVGSVAVTGAARTSDPDGGSRLTHHIPSSTTQ